MSLKVGGQAVIEGVMMKSKDKWSVAVRDPKGEIHVKTEPLPPHPPFLKLPVVRGVVALYQALVLGVKAIDFSATHAYGEEEEKLSPFAFASTMGVALVLGLGLFLVLPLYLTKILTLYSATLMQSSFLFNTVDGILRVLFFLAYVFGVGLWSEMRRVFEYHGAEHKVIFAYEAGKGMEMGSIQAFVTRHPRCGTSFLFIVMIISILVFTFIPKDWSFYAKLGSRVVLVPFIAGVSYELLRLSAAAAGNPVVQFLIQPGLLLQYITTKEPDDSQVEVALRALREVLPLEEQHG